MSDNEQSAPDAVGSARYANWVSYAVSPYDLTVTFGQRVADGPATQHTQVTMSLEHAVVMLMVGRRILREYCKQTGAEVKLPEALLKELQLNEESPLW